MTDYRERFNTNINYPSSTGDGSASSASNSGFQPDRVDGNRNASVCSTTSKATSGGDTPIIPGPVGTTQLDSPCSVASDGSSNWNGIPRVRRKWVDVVEGTLYTADYNLTSILSKIHADLNNLDQMLN